MRAFYEIPSKALNCKRRTAFRVKPHLHDHFEMLYTKSGRATVRVDDETYEMRDGDICVIFPHQIHSVTDDSEIDGAILMFSPDLLPDVQVTMRKKYAKSALITASDSREKIISLLLELLDEMPVDDSGSLAIKKGLALQIIGEVFRASELVEATGSNMQILRKIIDYCYKHYTEDITLEKMKNDLFVSKYYISYLFSNKMNISFTNFINSLRISDACRYLEIERYKISDIAERVGFSSLRTFNRVFRELIGATPSEYRECRLSGGASGLPTFTRPYDSSNFESKVQASRAAREAKSKAGLSQKENACAHEDDSMPDDSDLCCEAGYEDMEVEVIKAPDYDE